MMLIQGNIFIILLTVLLTVCSTTVKSFECPENCKCIEETRHAKCSSIEGLKKFEGGKNLTLYSLDLSNINLNRVPHFIEKLKDLVSIDLSYNHLSELGRYGRRVQNVNVSHNRITSPKLNHFPVHLKHLDLSFNEITYLPSELKELKHLRTIELVGNAINCSCQTLEVRNSLQHNHVWTSNLVKCSHPIEVKGKSWLQLKQTDMCKNDNPVNENENELMLGDAPFEDEGSGDQESFEELGKDYLPIDKNDIQNNNEHRTEEYNFLDVLEGSGDDSDLIAGPLTRDSKSEHLETTSEKENEYDDEEDDEEGSGGGALFEIPKLATLSAENVTEDVPRAIENEHTDEDESVTELNSAEAAIESSEPSSSEISSTTTESRNDKDIFGPGLGIVQLNDDEEEKTNESHIESSTPVTEEDIVPISVRVLTAEENEPLSKEEEEEKEIEAAAAIPETEMNSQENTQVIEDDQSDEMNSPIKASTDENRNTYILLAVILLVLVVLIIFVGIKRCNANRRNRRQEDIENGKVTELIDMDKKNLGKPLHKNGGGEYSPLINDRQKSNLAKPASANGKKIPYDEPKKGGDEKIQEPLLTNDKNTDPGHRNDDLNTKPVESNNNVPNSTMNGNAPVSAVRQTLEKPERQSRFGGYPPSKSKPGSSPRTSGDEDGFNSSSPRSGRYSPVYSPETGRVKIKLTETARPKTPLLVTRSRSNAGDIITTPTVPSSETRNTLGVESLGPTQQ